MDQIKILIMERRNVSCTFVSKESGANSTHIFLRKFQSATSRYLFFLPRCCGVWPHGKIKIQSCRGFQLVKTSLEVAVASK